MLKTLNQLYYVRLEKVWTDEARQAALEARRAKRESETPQDIKRRVAARRRLMSRIDRGRERLGLKPYFKSIQERVDFVKKDEGGRWITTQTGARVFIKDKADAPKEKPAKRKLSQAEGFKYYAKIKEGKFGKNVKAKLLNSQVGMLEGKSKAYRERAGKMTNKEKDDKGRTKDQLLSLAKIMKDKAMEYASMRDSLLGHSAQKLLKQDMSEQEIIDLIDSGEFDVYLLAELEEELGVDLSD